MKKTRTYCHNAMSQQISCLIFFIKKKKNTLPQIRELILSLFITPSNSNFKFQTKTRNKQKNLQPFMYFILFNFKKLLFPKQPTHMSYYPLFNTTLDPTHPHLPLSPLPFLSSFLFHSLGFSLSPQSLFTNTNYPPSDRI